MQDHHFDELREALGAQQGEGFEEKLSHMLNNKVGDDLDDEERDRREREYYRSMLEPKYVVVKEGGRYRFRARYTDYHRSMLSYDEIRMGKCDGGGLHGKDLSKADVSVNVVCFMRAQETGEEVTAYTAIGDDEVTFHYANGMHETQPYEEVVRIAREYIKNTYGSFECFAEHGLVYYGINGK